jgi:glycosyltransferase involved in cell wall biosynthesis
MAETRRVLLVTDHPSLDRGFATIGRHVASRLHASGRWEVHYLGLFLDAAPSDAGAYPFAVYTPNADDLEDVPGARSAPELAGRLSGDLPPGQQRLVVVMMGAPWQVSVVARQLAASTDRPRLHLAVSVPVDYFPLPRTYDDLLAAVDTLAPYTELSRRAFVVALSGTRRPESTVTMPVLNGVDVSTFRPLARRERLAARAAYFGVQDRDFVVGCFGRNTRHKRADLALRAFRVFVQGLWVICRNCDRATPFAFDPIDYAAHPPRRCRTCGARKLTRARARPDARLYLHAELLAGEALAASGGWDLELLVERMGLQRQVLFNRDLQVGRGVALTELAARMAACDAHLLLYEGGGWELTVLETAACGVPNVITDTANPPTYAAPFAVLIPPAAFETGPDGQVYALADELEAAQALARLADEPAVRRRLGRAGTRTAASYSWDRVGGIWLDILDRLCEVGRPDAIESEPLFVGASAEQPGDLP